MPCLANHERHFWWNGGGEHNAEGADRIREYELLVLSEEIEFLNECSSSLLCAFVDGVQTKVDKAQHLLSSESGENQLFVLLCFASTHGNNYLSF
jgi:hypothetical protein